MNTRARWGAGFLLVLGLSRMVAHLVGARKIAGLAAATGAAPAPKVFSMVLGLETFSSRRESIMSRLDDRFDSRSDVGLVWGSKGVAAGGV